jgi:hypothetical protein
MKFILLGVILIAIEAEDKWSDIDTFVLTLIDCGADHIACSYL